MTYKEHMFTYISISLGYKPIPNPFTNWQNYTLTQIVKETYIYATVSIFPQYMKSYTNLFIKLHLK